MSSDPRPQGVQRAQNMEDEEDVSSRARVRILGSWVASAGPGSVDWGRLWRKGPVLLASASVALHALSGEAHAVQGGWEGRSGCSAAGSAEPRRSDAGGAEERTRASK